MKRFIIGLVLAVLIPFAASAADGVGCNDLQAAPPNESQGIRYRPQCFKACDTHTADGTCAEIDLFALGGYPDEIVFSMYRDTTCGASWEVALEGRWIAGDATTHTIGTLTDTTTEVVISIDAGAAPPRFIVPTITSGSACTDLTILAWLLYKN
jgi:hypothetical protein